MPGGPRLPRAAPRAGADVLAVAREGLNEAPRAPTPPWAANAYEGFQGPFAGGELEMPSAPADQAGLSVGMPHPPPWLTIDVCLMIDDWSMIEN